MGFIDKMFKSGKFSDDKKSLSAFLSFDSSENKLPDPAQHNFYPYTRAYADKAWVYACVSLIADSLCGIDLQIKDAGGRIVQKHAAAHLLYRPNPYMSGREFIRHIAGSLELTGNAFILKDALIDGRPTEIYPLFSHLVEIVPSKSSQNPVKFYRYKTPKQTAYYMPEEVIHIKYFNPFDFYYGLSPLAAARQAADTLAAAENYNRSFFDNSGSVSGILSTEQKLDEASRLRIIKSWNDKYRGERNAHKVALLEGGLKWQPLGISQKDMDFISGMKLNRETMLAIFRIPPALLGVFEHSQQYNTKEQQRIFYSACIMPKMTLICDALTEFLLSHYDSSDSQYIEADYSKISALKEDAVALAQACEIYCRSGFTREEVVTALGLPFAYKNPRQG